MRSRKLLALLFCLITFPAIAGYMTLLGAGVGSIAPVVSWVSTTDAFPSSSLTYSGPSLSTMFDSTGKLTYKPNNLLTYSNTFSNASWTKITATVTGGVSDPFGGTAAFTMTATASLAQVYQAVTVAGASGINFIETIWIRRRSGVGTIAIYAPNGVTQVPVSVSGSWQQFSAKGVGNANIAYNTILIGSSGDAIDIYAGTLSAVTYETSPRTADQVITTSSAYYGPRIDYDPNTLAVKGLLIEEARTNYQVQSNALTTTWSTQNATVSSAGITAPDGTTNSWTLNEGAANGKHLLYYGTMASLSAGSTATASIFAKQGTQRYITIIIGDNSGSNGVYANADLQTGTITQTGTAGSNGTYISSAIQNAGNGWYRVSVTGSMSSAAGGYLMAVFTSNTATPGGFPSYAGTSLTVYLYGAQAELGSFATSYIPTDAASVTRAADVVQFTGTALTALQGSAGSAIVQMADQSAGYDASGGVALGGSSTYWLDLANGNMYSNSGSHILNTANAAVAGSPYRAGVAWDASGRSLAMNGGTVATDAFGGWAAITPYLGSLSGTANFANGHVASFAIYNQRLPDATLQAKSVVGASYAANDNGLRFADNDNLPIHWRVAL